MIARTTAMHYKGSHKDIAHIGRELDVDYIAEGAVRRTADQVAINVQLIQTSDQAHIFANKYDASMRDIFSMQRCIAQAIATQIPCIADRIGAGAVLGGGVKRKPTDDPVAYNLRAASGCTTTSQTPNTISRRRSPAIRITRWLTMPWLNTTGG